MQEISINKLLRKLRMLTSLAREGKSKAEWESINKENYFEQSRAPQEIPLS